ncbi:hypothetical protein D3C72_275640 [compost metagenome]
MAIPYQHQRGTRAGLNALAASSGIKPGQVYLVTDESRLAVGLSATTYEVFAKGSEGTARGLVWSITGKTIASEVFPGVAPYAFISTTARSIARARVAATASTVFTVKRNGTQVATITFDAGATVGVWSAGVTWADGDFATVEAPATADATLADITLSARA